MWIQVRTIDGTETQTIDDLSRLTKIECLREKIEETFRVSPDRQRLFYRGKQYLFHSVYQSRGEKTLEPKGFFASICRSQ
ncbi:hypothetical protein Nmel_008124 [Mimus melanotis]